MSSYPKDLLGAGAPPPPPPVGGSPEDLKAWLATHSRGGSKGHRRPGAADLKRLGLSEDTALPGSTEPGQAGPGKSPRRQEAGRAARARGLAAEAVIEASAAIYGAEGVIIRKRHTATKVLKRLGGGQFIGCFEKQSGVDMDVHLSPARYGIPGGLIEIKTTTLASISLDAVDPVNQAPELSQAQAMGLISAVLVRLREVWWVVPWAQWRSPQGRASLTAEDLDIQGARCPLMVERGIVGDAAEAPDWLPVLLKLVGP